MFFNRPVFASPEEDVDDVLDENLMLEFQFDELILEEMAQPAHFSARLGDSVVNIEVFRQVE